MPSIIYHFNICEYSFLMGSERGAHFLSPNNI